MNKIRSHLVAIAVATLAMHAAGVSLGALRVCWGNAHTHAGVAADDCPMHHHAPAQDTHRGHHGHGDAAAPANDDGQRLGCGCSSDPGSPYIGPAGIVAQVLMLSPVMSPVVVKRQHAASPDDVRFPPFAPPPRSTFSARS